MTLEDLKNSALSALNQGKPPYSDYYLEDGRKLFVKAWDKWTYDFILDGDPVGEVEVWTAMN